MPTVFDAHAHCFPHLATNRGGPQYEKQCLAEHQYHVRFHSQGIRRLRDNVPVADQLLAGDRDGISYLPDVNFRVGEFGRLEFTHGGEEYYIPWMAPHLIDLASSAELMVAKMDLAGVHRAVLQHDRVYGHLDDYLADCVRKFPDRFVALAQVDEWVGGQPEQLDRVLYEITELGFKGLYFSTGGFFHNDFAFGVNAPVLEPLWELIGELEVPIHWYPGMLRQPLADTYLRELVDLTAWAHAHPHIPSVLTHAMNTISMNRTAPPEERFRVPREIIELAQQPGWHIELMLHVMNGDHEFPPYNPCLERVVKILVDEVGSDKLVWGSDAPACERTVTYQQSMVLFQTRCDFLTPSQRAGIIGENLLRIYPLGSAL